MAAYALYVGGEVIHAFSMDPETAALAPIAAPTTAAGGGFMAFSADWNTLYILQYNATILSATSQFALESCNVLTLGGRGEYPLSEQVHYRQPGRRRGIQGAGDRRSGAYPHGAHAAAGERSHRRRDGRR
eukprot:COSAG02_NODE_1054_length_14930_cov_2157.848291_3_plen_130_part_00